MKYLDYTRNVCGLLIFMMYNNNNNNNNNNNDNANDQDDDNDYNCNNNSSSNSSSSSSSSNKIVCQIIFIMWSLGFSYVSDADIIYFLLKTMCKYIYNVTDKWISTEGIWTIHSQFECPSTLPTEQVEKFPLSTASRITVNSVPELWTTGSWTVTGSDWVIFVFLC